MTDIATFFDAAPPGTALEARHAALAGIFSEMGRVMVAFSGGVDSALALKVAVDTLGEDALAVTAVSPSLPGGEREATTALAEEIGARHVFIETHEIDRPEYQANDEMRCYHCKDTLYTELHEYARAHGYRFIADGSNVDDRGDYRPGRRAAAEHGVRSPLAEAGFTKDDVRALARHLGLRVWNKPAAACLASRVPYGTRVTPEVLAQIDRAEASLHRLGFHAVRVRHHGDVARIEAPPDRLGDVFAVRAQIIEGVRAAGYTFVSLDLQGYRTGSLNEVLETNG
ncbi:MAG: ATP-dependent sacrificial sulfur transferase LarE [Anaerolineae bacterium]|nr:ATP-dependent sacrificial sulfur transferase LarE [Anaerolineae bacterium]